MMGMGRPTGGSRMGQGPMPDMSAMMGPGMAAPTGQPRFPQQGHPSQQQQPQQTASQPMVLTYFIYLRILVTGMVII